VCAARSEPPLLTRPVAYDSEIANALIAEIQADLTERYGGPDDTPVDPAEFHLPSGVFLAATVDAEVIGCAGLRRHSSDAVELKRMYIRPAHRRRGLARALLHEVERWAIELGATRIVLETGDEQFEAVALYTACGYEPIPGYGFYRDHPGSRTFAKSLG
jgi:GNAT superfamily N-acetyltransferase